ncbi:hypothetical protein BN946_scf184732.g1 [Trametes cinnabarina]|uniref:Uncharacterized protein n=1 Tax=Pycnoporus cinnabarinus TaxID=5643 RepID=A0A060T0L7_PYCCI|nr:hypothetical protein BN946_scf184732.g1 [Trametes cinnabarina]
MTISKTITITGVRGKLGAPVHLTLAFIPSSADFDKVVPIAWKVLTLNEGDSISYDWTDLIGGCRAVIDDDTSKVSPREYAAIPIRKSSDLTKDTSKRPPVYEFSNPPSSIAVPKARVMNRTNGPVHIGAGFITDEGQQTEEAFNPVFVCPQVPDVSPAVLSTASLWDGDLAKITGKQISIKVSRISNVVVVDGPKVSKSAPAQGFVTTADAAPQSGSSAAVTYKANLAFATPNLLSVGVKAIVEGLLPKGYSFFKAITKGYDTDAELEVVLPQNISCNQAELDLIDAIEANKNTLWQGTWTDINPASQHWFSVNPDDRGDGAIERVAKKGAPAEVANGVGKSDADEEA